ncbi:hypothetical protein [Sulfurovum sp.]|uniref:hypothetical protein n=1 Tax=Sulfurovum sp. TaxID=1969726 RepID=UPI002867D060|nr:hypothetical protein [Sulfurovum sp.]
MTRCEEIIANVKMEECYAGLSLTFDGNEALRTEISEVIDKVKKETKMSPAIFDNSQNAEKSKPAFYIEFSDEVQRDSGDFFELVLKELKIDKCAHDVIEDKGKGKKC